MGACSQNEDDVHNILAADGYTNIDVGGHAFFGCGDDDSYTNRFTAEKNGMSVKGVVCAAPRKGSTIRVIRSQPISQ